MGRSVGITRRSVRPQPTLKSRTHQMEATLTIGEVARRAGLNTSAIRYYEACGVLPAPARENGRRRYTEDTVRRPPVIAIAKRVGFTLDEARVLLATADEDTPASAQIRGLAERKLPE